MYKYHKVEASDAQSKHAAEHLCKHVGPTEQKKHVFSGTAVTRPRASSKVFGGQGLSALGTVARIPGTRVASPSCITDCIRGETRIIQIISILTVVKKGKYIFFRYKRISFVNYFSDCFFRILEFLEKCVLGILELEKALLILSGLKKTNN